MQNSEKRYYFYFDDSGTRYPDRVTPTRKDGIDCFALGGILIEDNNRASLQASHTAFCDRWNIDYPLHSTAIRGKRNDFSWLGEDPIREEQFLNDLENLLVSAPVIGFATVIDRVGYNQRYRERYGDQRWFLCKTAYTILIERVCKYVATQNGTLSIIFEQTGKFEDRALIGYAKDMKRQGAPFNSVTSSPYNALGSNDYRDIIEGEPKRVTKESPLIQIADLYLYPMLKSGYDSTYQPWINLMNANKIINALLPEEDRERLGIKYSCFDI